MEFLNFNSKKTEKCHWAGIFLFLLILTACFLTKITIAAEPILAPIPEGEALYDGYEVTVAGKSVPVQACRVSAYPLNQSWPGYQRPLDQTEITGYVRWESADNEPVEVKVKVKRAIDKVTIRPLSLGITPVIDQDTITFQMPAASPVVLEINDYHYALHLLPGPAITPPADTNAPGLHYFGPGVHKIGVMEMKSNESVYLDAGAYIYGSFHALNAENIRIEGSGTIDNAPFTRGEAGGAFRLTGCKNVIIDGPVLRDPDVWTVNIFNCENVTIKNLRLIGLWRYNADGIDICNSRNVLVENCFVRSFDDSLVIKGLPPLKEQECKNITFRGCTVWCDWGRALEVGAETFAPEMTDLLFDDCDVIRTTGLVMDIQHYDRAAVHDVRFNNIRAEYDEMIPIQVLQTQQAAYPENPPKDYLPYLMSAVMPSGAPWSNGIHGTMRQIYFTNVTIYSDRMPPSVFYGDSAEHNIDGIHIENIKMSTGEQFTDAESLRLNIRPFVENVEIQ